VATMGHPHTIASINTFDSPSHAEESTKRLERAIYAYGFTTKPGIDASSSISARWGSRAGDSQSLKALLSVT